MNSDLPQNELEKRIRLAREFKARTCGKHLTSEMFGEIERATAALTPRVKLTPEEARERKRAARKVSNFRHKITVAERMKKESGGTYGVSLVEHANKPRWRAHLDQRVSLHGCAITAAKRRNDYMRKRYPGYDMLQVDIDAIWVKWGCACGKHKKQEQTNFIGGEDEIDHDQADD